MAVATDLDALLTEAVGRGASDIHITEGARPRCRIVGELVDMDYDILRNSVIVQYLIPQEVDALAKRTLSDTGQLDFSYEVRGVGRFRVNCFKHKGALALVFRYLKDKVPQFKELGLPQNVLSLTNERRGMILVTGVTGSGKSTTLASLVDNINRNMAKHIITLEAPIEYQHWHQRSNVCQREIGRDVESFQSGLVASLREDPDIILVGEMRDLETMETALLAAETGHLLLSTLHTMGAAETVERITNTFPEAQQKQVRSRLASSLRAIVSQQLLPKKDKSGYVVAYELLFVNRKVQELILDGSALALRDYMSTSEEAKRDGCILMDDCIFNLITSGVVYPDVAMSYAFDRKAMSARIDNYYRNGGVTSVSSRV